MDKILVSACLLGEKVRYDGKSQQVLHLVLKQWQAQQRLIAICPEVAGGLSVPRAPAEINSHTGSIITQQGVDVTTEFSRGAQLALDLCQRHHIRFALLKESSPSCGSSQVYDGSFQGNKIPGQGVTAALLIKNDIEVYSEQNIEQLIQRIAIQ